MAAWARWCGAVLSLLLIGLMRFGMGLLNIQGQVQGMVIGLLLILSILLPLISPGRFGRERKIDRLTTVAAVAVGGGCVRPFSGLFLLVARRCLLAS